MPLAPGLTPEAELVVDESMTADRMHLQIFEMTAIRRIVPHLEPLQGSVGTRAEIAHLAATPLDMRVRCNAELIELEGKRLTFRLDAHDEKESIGTGTHERFLIDVTKFLSRVEPKTG